jgi:chromosome segregation protein
MRLGKIKLAGFKSFVDPTTIHLPGNLVGVVGPNGCGKSNVIDAIRWVMGETSAKHLRGDSMADVIFNGCATRKPVGTATIELVFDNSDGAIGGQYARYSEVSIKRIVSRDGTSQYFLNNARCRRKDITGIFLGTGLGPRSYAIIEQGMVSRLIEAKPDEMRVYIEEAAGISKYKERRRETENRIRHTRDNLDRLNDLREEVDKQIKHLQRQAKQAERYKDLKQAERRLEAELLAIRLAELDRKITEQNLELSQAQTKLEAALADQRSVEANIETARQRHLDATDQFNAAQGTYYAVQSEISRLEQSIAHGRETRQRQEKDLSDAQVHLAEICGEIEKDREQLEELEARLKQLVPNLDEAKSAEAASTQAFRRAEEALDRWQDAWHELNLECKEHQQTQQVERTRIEHLESQLMRLRVRQTELNEEQRGISIVGLEDALTEQARREQTAAAAARDLNVRLTEIDREIGQLRDREEASSEERERLQAELESRRGRVETLEALQDAAFGQGQTALEDWLSHEDLNSRPRLAQQISVANNWERAVETVLGNFLQGVCVTRCDDHLGRLPETQVGLIETGGGSDNAPRVDGFLLSKVTAAGSASELLANVRTADSLDEAMGIRERLGPGQSVITPDGTWLGHGWVRVNRGHLSAEGLLTREQDIRELRDEIRDLEQQTVRTAADRQNARQRLQLLEAQRAQALEDSKEVNREATESSTIVEAMRQEFERARGRLTALTRDGQSLRDEIEGLAEAARQASSRLKLAEEAAARLDARRPALQKQQQTLLQEYNECRAQWDQHRATVSRISIEYESRRASRESASTTLSRVRAQQEQLATRIESLTSQIAESEAPLYDLQQELGSQLAKEIEADRALADQRRILEDVEALLRSEEARRTEREQHVAEVRGLVDSLRMDLREVEVRREGVAEQFDATGLDLVAVAEGLPDDSDLTSLEGRLDLVRRRINRLGPINLAAIDEFTEQSERKTYLDAQFEDLISALDTLERAIRKIDRETRSRFRETFDNVNKGLKRIFPRLFAGGHAYLSLDGEDLLNAGVTVMAQPPGKRNSHIHLLSGGEKALTAVALIFSIFELNPAPFCLLDEVDAPLDDANVSRFCEIVREMAGNVQFIVITHNKTTMEMASQLTGVTMHEAGVSRLVSVDIDEAVQLAAS